MHAFLKGFAYAARGVGSAIRDEKNMRFHLCAAFYVLLFSRFYSFNNMQYVALLMIISLVFGMEMLNTAVERLVDKLCPAHNIHAGFVKDVAAGAVLVVSIGAAICGFLLFWNMDVFAGIVGYFAIHLGRLALLLASMGFSVWFVLGFGSKKSAAHKGES